MVLAVASFRFLVLLVPLLSVSADEGVLGCFAVSFLQTVLYV